MDKKPTHSNSHGWGLRKTVKNSKKYPECTFKTHRNIFNDEALYTLLIEVETIVSSRPMTTVTINNVQSHVPLSPSNLLTMKSKVLMPPSGSFRPADTNYCKFSRRALHKLKEFVKRWCKEFIQTVQEQKLCRKKRRNFLTGDMVLLKSDFSRNY